MKKIKEIIPTKEYTEIEIEIIADKLLSWLKEKPEHIFIDYFLYAVEFIPAKDVDYLIQKNEKFKEVIDQANAIELAKLKEYGAGDRLNASIVKQILINKHNWL